MKPRLPVITGIILILLGGAILVHRYYGFNWHFFRSYGFFGIGFLGILRGLSLTPRKGIYLSAFIMFVGFYYMLGEWGVIEIDRGLTIAAFTLFIGGAFIVQHLLGSRKWEQLLFGTVFLTIGILFLLEHFRKLPPDLLPTLVDVYWPVLLILIGVAFLIHAIYEKRRRELTTHSQDG